MSESFAELFEESLKTLDMKPGSIVTGVVMDIDNEWVTVHAGLKSEGVIPRSEFVDASGECALVIGDEVQVALEAVEDGFGETRLSREKAKRSESWTELGSLQSNYSLNGHFIQTGGIAIDPTRGNRLWGGLFCRRNVRGA